MSDLIRDLSDEECRAALVCKWGEVEADVLPAWIAEMDYAIAEPITEALHRAISRGMTGYPALGGGGPLGEAYAGFAARHYEHQVDPAQVLPTVDVTAGVRLVLDVIARPGGLVMPVPGYSPQLDLAAITGRERLDLVVDPDAARAELDLDQLDRHFANGAAALLLTQPHNPWGRVFSRAELEGVRDVVTRHGGFVISDEIHAPLVLHGRDWTSSPARSGSPDSHEVLRHVPYLSIEGTAEHTVAVVAASKAFNIAGLKCAQLVTASPRLSDALQNAPMARNDSWSVLGVEASIAAYTQGDAWLAALLDRLSAQRDLLGRLLATHLPEARMRPLEATYLAWIDLRAYGHDDPAAVALERRRVQVSAGHDYHPGLPGHVRLNIATSAERLREVVERIAQSVTRP